MGKSVIAVLLCSASVLGMKEAVPCEECTGNFKPGLMHTINGDVLCKTCMTQWLTTVSANYEELETIAFMCGFSRNKDHVLSGYHVPRETLIAFILEKTRAVPVPSKRQ